jgi:hypothetical protein
MTKENIQKGSLNCLCISKTVSMLQFGWQLAEVG